MKSEEIAIGNVVVGPDDEILGTVYRCESNSFTVRKGRFFPHDTDVSYDDVASVQGEEIRLWRDPTVFSESEATPESVSIPRATDTEAGHDFGGDRTPTQADAATRVKGIEAGEDFGGKRKIA